MKIAAAVVRAACPERGTEQDETRLRSRQSAPRPHTSDIQYIYNSTPSGARWPKPGHSAASESTSERLVVGAGRILTLGARDERLRCERGLRRGAA